MDPTLLSGKFSSKLCPFSFVTGQRITEGKESELRGIQVYVHCSSWINQVFPKLGRFLLLSIVGQKTREKRVASKCPDTLGSPRHGPIEALCPVSNGFHAFYFLPPVPEALAIFLVFPSCSFPFCLESAQKRPKQFQYNYKSLARY